MRNCKCEHWQVCDECRPKEWENAMTQQNKIITPRKAKFFLAYRWNIEGTVYHRFIADSEVVLYQGVGGWKVKEIELEETQ